MDNLIFWDVTQCRLVNSYWLFYGVYCFHLQGQAVWHLSASPWRWTHKVPLMPINSTERHCVHTRRSESCYTWKITQDTWELLFGQSVGWLVGWLGSQLCAWLRLLTAQLKWFRSQIKLRIRNWELLLLLLLLFTPTFVEARGGAVGWSAALQAGRSRVGFPMVSLSFFIDKILSPALWPCDRLIL